jgi:hypothetical protein
MTRASSKILPKSEGVPPPAEGRPILLRAYAEAKPATAKKAKLQQPSEWVLVFDCETRVDETQRLSTRWIPRNAAGTTEVTDMELRRLFEVACALGRENRRQESSDKDLVSWIANEVEQRGLTAIAEELGYDAANLNKVVTKKRGLSAGLRKQLMKGLRR